MLGELIGIVLAVYYKIYIVTGYTSIQEYLIFFIASSTLLLCYFYIWRFIYRFIYKHKDFFVLSFLLLFTAGVVCLLWIELAILYNVSFKELYFDWWPILYLQRLTHCLIERQDIRCLI